MNAEYKYKTTMRLDDAKADCDMAIKLLEQANDLITAAYDKIMQNEHLLPEEHRYIDGDEWGNEDDVNRIIGRIKSVIEGEYEG